MKRTLVIKGNTYRVSEEDYDWYQDELLELKIKKEEIDSAITAHNKQIKSVREFRELQEV